MNDIERTSSIYLFPDLINQKAIAINQPEIGHTFFVNTAWEVKHHVHVTCVGWHYDKRLDLYVVTLKGPMQCDSILALSQSSLTHDNGRSNANMGQLHFPLSYFFFFFFALEYICSHTWLTYNMQGLLEFTATAFSVYM